MRIRAPRAPRIPPVTDPSTRTATPGRRRAVHRARRRDACRSWTPAGSTRSGDRRPSVEVLEILRSHQYVKGPPRRRLRAGVRGVRGRRARGGRGLRHGRAHPRAARRAPSRARRTGGRWCCPPSPSWPPRGPWSTRAASPVFADVRPDTHNLDPQSLAARVSDRTAAVIPVHLFGSPVDVDELREALPTPAKGVFVLEDAAQAIHATVRRPAGRCARRRGDVLVLPVEEPRRGRRRRHRHDRRRRPGPGRLRAPRPRPDAEAVRPRARGHEQPDGRDPGRGAAREAAADRRLDRRTPRDRGALRPRLPGHGRSVPRSCGRGPRAPTTSTPFACRIATPSSRRSASAACRRGVYYPLPLHRQTCFARYAPEACPVADTLAGEVLSLPCFPGLTVAEQDRVIEAVREVVARLRASRRGPSSTAFDSASRGMDAGAPRHRSRPCFWPPEHKARNMPVGSRAWASNDPPHPTTPNAAATRGSRPRGGSA